MCSWMAASYLRPRDARWKHESRSCKIEITDGLLGALHVSCRIRHIAPGPAAVIRIPLLTSLSTSTGFLPSPSPAVEQLEQGTFRMPLPKAGFTSEASPHFISSTQLASPVRAVHELEEGLILKGTGARLASSGEISPNGVIGHEDGHDQSIEMFGGYLSGLFVHLSIWIGDDPASTLVKARWYSNECIWYGDVFLAAFWLPSLLQGSAVPNKLKQAHPVSLLAHRYKCLRQPLASPPCGVIPNACALVAATGLARHATLSFKMQSDWQDSRDPQPNSLRLKGELRSIRRMCILLIISISVVMPPPRQASPQPNLSSNSLGAAHLTVHAQSGLLDRVLSAEPNVRG
ncbi:predicted protein [Postia placenta Mad-698-R]|nr:predicted protein [Postia placenta Mad-698-R]